MNQGKQKQNKRLRRHRRIRAKVFGTADRPRLAVFRSNRGIYTQVIDDERGSTLAAISSAVVSGKTATERAKEVGKRIAAIAIEKKIMKVVFDRGGYMYRGKIKALADGAREAGLVF